jgi:S1-C subfamily serine protease
VLGVNNGDTIHTVNGVAAGPDSDLPELLRQLRESSTVEVSITRRGKPLLIRYTIR